MTTDFKTIKVSKDMTPEEVEAVIRAASQQKGEPATMNNLGQKSVTVPAKEETKETKQKRPMSEKQREHLAWLHEKKRKDKEEAKKRKQQQEQYLERLMRQDRKIEGTDPIADEQDEELMEEDEAPKKSKTGKKRRHRDVRKDELENGYDVADAFEAMLNGVSQKWTMAEHQRQEALKERQRLRKLAQQFFAESTPEYEESSDDESEEEAYLAETSKNPSHQPTVGLSGPQPMDFSAFFPG